MLYVCKTTISLTKIAERPCLKLLTFAAILATTLLSSCFLKQDRTTTIYGTITDQNGEPVDSIMVIARGQRGFTLETLNQTYSRGDGHYEMLVNVPKKFKSIDISVPFLFFENPKFSKSTLENPL